jgi:hypothetical protein
LPARRTRSGANHRRVLLVGLPPLSLDALEPALRETADVLSVPFPGASFDRAVEEFDADMVVVDVTYLDESRVRPLIVNRFLSSQPVLVFVADGGQAGCTTSGLRSSKDSASRGSWGGLSLPAAAGQER